MDVFIAAHAKSLLHSMVLFPFDVVFLLQGVLYRIDPDEQEDDKALVGVGETNEELQIAAWSGFCHLILRVHTMCDICVDIWLDDDCDRAILNYALQTLNFYVLRRAKAWIQGT